MDRRTILRTLFLGSSAAAPPAQREQAGGSPEQEDPGILSRKWHVLSGSAGKQHLMPHTPFMNWELGNSGLICRGDLPESAVFLSDYRLAGQGKSFKAEMVFEFNDELIYQDLHIGFRLRSTAKFDNASPYIDCGLSADGSLFIGSEKGDRALAKEVLKGPLRLVLSVTSQSAGGCFAKLRAFDRSGNVLGALSSTKYDTLNWQGNIGVLSHFSGNDRFENRPSVVISRFKIDGDMIIKTPFGDEYAIT